MQGRLIWFPQESCQAVPKKSHRILPLKQPVIVASAPPNLPLVEEFVRRNGLALEVRELDDRSTELLDAEILINTCRNDLTHCRWGPALRRINEEFDRRVVFWKGQMGDRLFTPAWCNYPRSNTAKRNYAIQAPWFFGLTRLTFGRGEYKLRAALEVARVTQRQAFRNFWERGAMWQGAHVSFIRQVTGALVVSIYHGPAVMDVLGRVDLRLAARFDLRERIGEILAGRRLRYPATNPGPPRSWIRAGHSHLAAFLEVWRSLGLEVEGAIPV